MKKHVSNYLSILSLILVIMLAGWDGSSMGGDSEKGVRFIIPIEVEKFSEDKPILIKLWTAEEFKISREMSRKCYEHYNMDTKTWERKCKEGVEYQEVTPEEFRIPVKEIAFTIEVRSKKIKVGEGYTLKIGGVRKDKRFTLVAIVEDTARSETITLENLTWKYLSRPAE